MHRVACVIVTLTLASGCTAPSEQTPAEEDTPPPSATMSFEDDLAFLREHTDVILLADAEGQSQVAVVPQYQGRVMTSTAGGADGASYGWLNRDAIASGENQPHINVFGGEDRFWLGPEGGQFSIFFKEADPFDLEHWQTPEPIDWGGWELSNSSDTEALFRKSMELTNYSGTVLALDVERSVRLLSRQDAAENLGRPFGENSRVVAFESVNTITNTGDAAWTEQTGMLSVWILGMFNPAAETTIVVPFVAGPEEELGIIVNDSYFGKVPEERLSIDAEAGVLFFRGDGEYRAKIGIPRARAMPVAGSYDAAKGILTLVQYTLPQEATAYVNSMWEIQDAPFAGDVVNSYNDGPPAPGAPPLGPFYELETSSPAAELEAGESLTHVHRTIHIEGPEAELEPVAQALLGVSLERITSAFR